MAFLSFVKNKGNNFGKSISKYLSGECSQKLSDHAKKSARGALKTSLKKVTQKTAEATCDSIGSKFFDNITEISIASLQKNSETLWKWKKKNAFYKEIPKERYISPE